MGTIQLIEGLSVVGISLLILGVFVSNQKEKSLADISSHGILKDLGYSVHSSDLDNSVHSGPYPNSEDTHTFGGKRKKKTRKNNL
jgi:hypothetical protein